MAVGSQALIAETHWAIADVYRLMGNWLKAADQAEQAAQAWREIVKPWGIRESNSHGTDKSNLSEKREEKDA